MNPGPRIKKMIDCQKQQLTVHKHGVSFEEAKTVFENVLAVIFDDEAYSVSEKREIIGHSRNNRLLLISFTKRSNTIRIISTRLATPREGKD
jgi:uncharacterized DUF497 family protein